MPYAEAIATLRIRQARPALRHGDPTICRTSSATPSSASFKQIVADGGVVRGFAVPGGNSYSRSQLDVLVDQAKQMGFTGLIWVRPGEPPLSSVEGAERGDAARRRSSARGATADDLLLMAAGAGRRHVEAARPAAAGDREEGEPAEPGRVRVPVGHRLSAARIQREDDSAGIRCTTRSRRRTTRTSTSSRADPGAVRAKAYDLVLNGIGDRRRQHPNPRRGAAGADLQRLGISDEEAKLRFGFFLEALEYGTPPHGGIALGLDRIVAILAGEASIREVIAFPKTANAVDLMAGAPSPVDAKQLRELAFARSQN